METPSPHDDSLALLAMRLRAVTGCTPIHCRQVLEPLSDEARHRYVQHFESNPSHLLLDPIELDPQFREAFATVAREAKQKLVAGELGVGLRGRGGRMWGWMKGELMVRYGVAWRTPAEMTPSVVLD